MQEICVRYVEARHVRTLFQAIHVLTSTLHDALGGVYNERYSNCNASGGL